MSYRHRNLVNAAAGLTPREKSVLGVLADAANDSHVCWPKINTVCKKTALSRSTVIRALGDLSGRGLITAFHRRRGDEQLSNLYRIHVAALTALTEPDEQEISTVAKPAPQPAAPQQHPQPAADRDACSGPADDTITAAEPAEPATDPTAAPAEDDRADEQNPASARAPRRRRRGPRTRSATGHRRTAPGSATHRKQARPESGAPEPVSPVSDAFHGDTPAGSTLTPPGCHADTQNTTEPSFEPGKQRAHAHARTRGAGSACLPGHSSRTTDNGNEETTTPIPAPVPASTAAISAEAIDLLRKLEFSDHRTHVTGQVIRQHGPAVTALLTSGGWTYAELKKHLESECSGNLLRPMGRLVCAIRDTQPRTTRTGAQQVPWCGRCDDPDIRMIDDPDTNSVHLCPDCHPTVLRRRAEQATAA